MGEGDKERRAALKKEIAANMNLEVISLRQKARDKWLKEGDRNTKYFHCLANFRRKNNYVQEMEFEGKVVKGNDNLGEKAHLYFQNLYREEEERRPLLDDLTFKKLSIVSRAFLEARFSEKEVWGCLGECNGDKTPGPDGFNMKFTKIFERP